jgi:mRNA-degrading endonuclease RelE of RelBE toxin-antitoxin system
LKPTFVRFTPQAAKLISKVHPEIKKMVRSALEELRKNPFSGDDLQEELSGFKSYKPGRYRILYKFNADDNSVDVYYVGHRRDVYEQLRVLLKQHQED